MPGKRTWRPKERNPIDPVPGGEEGFRNYQSYQKIINSNNGEIDEELLEEHVEGMMNHPKYDWQEIAVNFRLVKTGDRIRYTTLNPKGQYLFRTGGWVISIDEEKYEWLVYRAHTQTNWTLQAKDCQRLFIIKKPIKIIKKKINYVIFKRPRDETGHEVYLKDRNGNNVIVFSARDSWAKKRFEESAKFMSVLDGKEWRFADEVDE